MDKIQKLVTPKISNKNSSTNWKSKNSNSLKMKLFLQNSITGLQLAILFWLRNKCLKVSTIWLIYGIYCLPSISCNVVYKVLTIILWIYSKRKLYLGRFWATCWNCQAEWMISKLYMPGNCNCDKCLARMFCSLGLLMGIPKSKELKRFYSDISHIFKTLFI